MFLFFFCEIIITVEKHRDANNKFSLSLSKKMNEYTTTIAKESEILLKEAIFSIFPITSGSLLFRNFFFFFFLSVIHRGERSMNDSNGEEKKKRKNCDPVEYIYIYIYIYKRVSLTIGPYH